MLLYREGTFMQALEGEKDTVRGLYARIGRDPRHEKVTMLTEGEIKQRVFPDWTMGFHHLTDEVVHSLPGYTEFLQKPLTVEWLFDNPSQTVDLLSMFRSLKSG